MELDEGESGAVAYLPLSGDVALLLLDQLRRIAFRLVYGSGVSPSPVKAPMSAPSSTNAVTTATCPCCAAEWSGVPPLSADESTSAPTSTSTRTASTCPSCAAACSGLAPPSQGRFTSAPSTSLLIFTTRRQRPRCAVASAPPWHHTDASLLTLCATHLHGSCEWSILRSCGSCSEGGFHGRMPTRAMITPHLHPPVPRLHPFRRDGNQGWWSFHPPSHPRGDHAPCSQVTCDSPPHTSRVRW
jgi:hypothetical protein